jgi:hypothetical protein
MNEDTKPKTTAASSGQVDQIVMRYAKDFDPDAPVVENCKYMAALGKIQTLEQQLDKADELINTLYESGDLKIYMEELVQAHLTAYNV